MKILCICNAGNVRSVCLAKMLKNLEQEAIAIGIMLPIANDPRGKWSGFTNESIEQLLDWCDFAVNLSDYEDFTFRGLKNKNNKTIVRIDIGPDIWDDPQHFELVSLMKQVVERNIKLLLNYKEDKDEQTKSN